MSTETGDIADMPQTPHTSSLGRAPSELSSTMSKDLTPMWKPAVEKKVDETKLLPEQYTNAVVGFSLLPDGSGQNYAWLGSFLKHGPPSFGHNLHATSLVIQYPLGLEKGDRLAFLPGSTPTKSTPVSSYAVALRTDQNPNAEVDIPNQKHDRYRRKSPINFSSPYDFYTNSVGEGSSNPQSGIIFLRGYMSAEWIGNIGARFFVDPEFFCRHMDFQNPDEPTKNFSLPALPSSSSHILELPVMTIGIDKSRKALGGKTAKATRDTVDKALDNFRERFTKMEMVDGESMIRDFYLFDEMHFAVEQRISICMEKSKDGKTFQLLVWLDSGTEGHSFTSSGKERSYSPYPISTQSEPYSDTNRPSYPWEVASRDADRYYLPVTLRKHKIALKTHLFQKERSESDPSARSAAHLPEDYGRSLHSSVMAKDAFYCLTEILEFAASSHMEFLNLIDLKLDQYTSLPATEDYKVLPNLKYTKKILYQYIQKTERLLASTRQVISSESRWPKASSADQAKSEKAMNTAQRIVKDFEHLLKRANTLHKHTSDAIHVLFSSISISESQRAIEQAEDMGRLTFLAFLFVPLSLATSFFGMNFKELDDKVLSLWWWAVASVICLAMAVTGYYSYPYVQQLKRLTKDMLLRMAHRL
ncbi:cora-like Mg2+ transporter protein-domain-containing protein [Sordaria brevicollis]|uniref:Cora-like Mg2+ transporter protein-domain-containing protein n=1 Tax=Sordaria brevicollis TaxID=83679 RepID=A0AAE0U6I0_SORBR|nr:cora-like Mg2+ transporter protein-domain-containing protein [Sordaria brevicollis]